MEQAVPNPVGPADHYHADRIRPYWAKQKQKVAKIGHHIFYF
ncbi:cell wall hydrolase [Thiolapillus sp.]